MLSIDGTGTLDLNDNNLVVTSGDLSTIQRLVFGGYSPTPNSAKAGIISTTGQNSGGNTLLMLFDNSFAGATDWPIGSGNTVSPNAIIGRYTYFGDTNLDGQVTGDDYAAIDASLGKTGLAPGAEILYGDTNFDGSITGDDYAPIDANLGLGVGNPLATATTASPAISAQAGYESQPLVAPPATSASSITSPFNLASVIDGSGGKEKDDIQAFLD